MSLLAPVHQVAFRPIVQHRKGVAKFSILASIRMHGRLQTKENFKNEKKQAELSVMSNGNTGYHKAN